MTRAELASKYFKEGYACSQAVVLAFHDLTNMEFDELQKVALPFGGGFGRLRLTCGAVSGITIIASLLLSIDNVKDNKSHVYEIVQDLVERFEKEYKTINCKELLENAGVEAVIGGEPETRTEEYYKKRPCEKIVVVVTQILENYLIEKGIIK